MSIPKKIHRIWLGGAMPEEFERFEQRWVELHPGWEVHTWREHELDWLANRRAFEDAPLLSSKSNIARYEVILREGGLYVDTDYEPLRSFEDLLDGSDLILVEEEPGFFANALFGAAAGHPVLAAVVAGLSESHFALAGESSPQRTGPHYWTRSVRRSLVEHPDLTVQVLSRNQVMPYSWRQPHLRYAAFPDAWAVHHWAKSWVATERRRPAAALLGRVSRRAAVGVKSRARGVRAWWDGIEPTTARKPSRAPVYLGDGRLLCFMSGSIPLLVPGSCPELVAAVTLDGDIDPAMIRFAGAVLRGGDVVVDIGAGIGALSLRAAWIVGRMGRVFAFEDDPERSECLLRSVEINRRRGLQAEVIVDTRPLRGGDEGLRLDDALRGVPEIRLLRLAAGPSQAQVLATATKLLERRSVRLLDLGLSDRAAGRNWRSLVELLRGIGQKYEHSSFAVKADGSRKPMSIQEALNSDFVDHFVLEFASPIDLAGSPG